jgi:divalent metal cation (Fe/Co/Zn/Cd) transporter
VLTKLALFAYYKSTAKKIDSSILSASAVDCLTDCISTAVVAVSCVIGKFTGLNIDGYAGLIVSLFIGWSAFNMLKDISSKLIGQAPDNELLKEIKDKILSHDGVLDVHDLSVYCYGPNKYFASAHIEVDANVDVMISHELVDDIERDFIKTTNIVLTGHLDPIVTDNETVNALKGQVVAAVKDISEDFSIHDFRVVFGENHTNVLFDVAIPYETSMSKHEVSEKVKEAVKSIDEKYCAVITVEYCV